MIGRCPRPVGTPARQHQRPARSPGRSSSWSSATAARGPAPCAGCCPPRGSSSPPRPPPPPRPRRRSSLHQPGAVLLDLDPAAGGIEAIERIMGTRPTPVVVCGALAAALRRRARRGGRRRHRCPGRAAHLTAVRHRPAPAPPGRQPGPGHHPSPQPAARARHGRHGAAGRRRPVGLDAARASEPACGRPRVPAARTAASQVRVVVIGASTGGPPALATILADLPADLPVPRARRPAHGRRLRREPGDLAGRVVPAAGRAGRARPRDCVPASSTSRPPASTPCCGPGCGSSCARRRPGSSTCPASTPPSPAPPRSAGRTPSVSCSPGWAGTAPPGCARCADAGALTLGQDEPSSVVWGMPAAAQALGAVERGAAPRRDGRCGHRRRGVPRGVRLDGPDRP